MTKEEEDFTQALGKVSKRNCGNQMSDGSSAVSRNEYHKKGRCFHRPFLLVATIFISDRARHLFLPIHLANDNDSIYHYNQGGQQLSHF